MARELRAAAVDLTWLFLSKRCDKMSLERSLPMSKKSFSAEQIVTLLGRPGDGVLYEAIFN
jgi:hypothetical protein